MDITDGADESAQRRADWRLVGMRGSDAPEREPGLARTTEVTYENEMGETDTYRLWVPDGTDDQFGHATLLSVIQPGMAEACPICRAPAPVMREHVPPQYLGGIKMVNTCDPCNHGLGAKTEGALREWFDQRSRFRLTVPGRQEPIANGWVLPRTTDEGKPLIILDTPQITPGEADVFA